MEELIVFNSNNHVYYTKYADASEYTCSVHHSRNTRYHQILSWMNRISADHLWCIDNFTAPTGIYKFNVPYAQIKYTEGKSIETARKYYAHALRLNKSSMRALFGFYLVGEFQFKIVFSVVLTDTYLGSVGRFACAAVDELCKRIESLYL